MIVERYTPAEERANAAVHGLGALLGISGLVVLIVQANAVGRAGSLPAVIVYGTALILLFLSSTLHHAIPRPRIKHFLLSVDHCGIFALIAGTYTPFCLLMPPGQAWILLSIIWGLAAAGIAIQLAAFLTGRGDRYERAAFVLYLAMGWIPLLWAGQAVLDAMSRLGLGLLVAGGIAYSVGVIFYLWKRLPFGHAIWHLFVVVGAALHYFSILLCVVPRAG